MKIELVVFWVAASCLGACKEMSQKMCKYVTQVCEYNIMECITYLCPINQVGTRAIIHQKTHTESITLLNIEVFKI
jgi:hypothetical protein